MSKYLIVFTIIKLALSACPNGWIEHESSCYFFSHDVEYWAGAFEMCRIIGGQLVEIEDGVENSFLASQASLTGRQYWIGLSDVINDGTWVWMSSNSPSIYTNWNPGEPTVTNTHGQFENCADMYPTGKWNDVPCLTPKYFVCEKTNRLIDIIG